MGEHSSFLQESVPSQPFLQIAHTHLQGKPGEKWWSLPTAALCSWQETLNVLFLGTGGKKDATSGTLHDVNCLDLQILAESNPYLSAYTFNFVPDWYLSIFFTKREIEQYSHLQKWSQMNQTIMKRVHFIDGCQEMIYHPSLTLILCISFHKSKFYGIKFIKLVAFQQVVWMT